VRRLCINHAIAVRTSAFSNFTSSDRTRCNAIRHSGCVPCLTQPFSVNHFNITYTWLRLLSHPRDRSVMYHDSSQMGYLLHVHVSSFQNHAALIYTVKDPHLMLLRIPVPKLRGVYIDGSCLVPTQLWPYLRQPGVLIAASIDIDVPGTRSDGDSTHCRILYVRWKIAETALSDTLRMVWHFAQGKRCCVNASLHRCLLAWLP